jgi:hypothetical protein
MLSEPQAEDLIRKALLAQADRALTTADVLEGMDVRRAAHTRRTRRLGVVAAVVAVLVAVAIPVTLLGGGRSPEAAANGPQLTIPYQPTWVPPGWVASSRTLNRVEGELPGLDWTLAHQPADHTDNWLNFIVSDSRQMLPTNQVGPTREVMINGVQGFVSSGDAPQGSVTQELMTTVAWSPKPGTWLAITGEQPTDGTDMQLRMARSVVADPVATDVPYTYGYLPPHAIPFAITIEGHSSHDWSTGPFVIFLRRDQIHIGVEWGPGAVRPQLKNAKPVTVRGHSGSFETDSPSTATGTISKLLTQQDGWWLEVTATNVTEAQLLHIVNDMSFYPNANYDWLGR